MRHLRSILYALILAPAAWILCGVGFDENLTGRARDNGGIESLTGVLLLLLAGMAYAILLFAPISPAGPLLAGLGFLGVGAWARIAPGSYASVWPADVTKDGFNVSTPGYGLVVLLAVPLICTALSARRWAAYEPPQVVLIGTLGRARGAATAPGTPMAAEPTTVFPAPPFPHQRPPADEEEKTTLLTALFPAAQASEEPTRDVAQSEEATRDVAASEDRTTLLLGGDQTQLLGVPGSGAPGSGAPESGAPGSGEETTVLPPVGEAAAAEGAPAEATTKSMSILGEERPDPAQDPTTRLAPVNPPDKTPGEATTQSSKTTVANVERPADEAADDTRPLTLPAPRRPSDDEPTTRL
ncbi:hypothetical protein AB0J80_17530 [Actinoplanes sp. NPDC049548]|uniref:hypothetical protein n=1 Tax=Actinoplanes sp. NPDC049548 TaxID=3155152 RepID=UPI003437ADCE